MSKKKIVRLCACCCFYLLSAIFNLGFELYANEKSTLFYDERITIETDVDFFFLSDCQQTGDRNHTVVVCDPKSHSDLKMFNLEKLLRALLQHARLAQCSEEIVRTTIEGDVRVKSKCEPYRRSWKHSERFYLICGEKLPSKPLLLIVSGQFKEPSLGHRLNGAYYGWSTAVILLSVVSSLFSHVNKSSDTTNSDDCQELYQALSAVSIPVYQTTILMVDRLVNSQVNSRRLLHVEQCFGKGGMPLNVFGRVLVGEGVLVKMCRKKPKQRQFFLFNDYLVYGNIVISKKRYNKQRAIPLENVKLANVQDEGALKNGWIIKTPQKSFAVYAATPTEKQEWMIHIERSVAELLEKGKRSATEHAPVWVPDGEASVCMACKKTQFTLVQRRHHCRACGSCVCGNCSTHSFKIDAQKKKPVRVCDQCYDDLNKAKSDGQGVLTHPVETLQENTDSSSDSEEEEGKEDSKMEIPPLSLDPEDVTYSYKAPNDPSLWGPYCYSCMERWYSVDYFSSETPIFIHAEQYAVPFGLDQLIETNGPLHPFTFGRLEEPVRVICCTYENCRKDRSVSRGTFVDAHNQSETEEGTSESIQEYPLLTRWTPRAHDTTLNLTEQEFQRLNKMLGRMSETNLEKLNQNFKSNNLPENCDWCGDQLSTISDIIFHIISTGHRQELLKRTSVSIKDVYLYVNMQRAAARWSLSSRIPFLEGQLNAKQPMQEEEVLSIQTELNCWLVSSQMIVYSLCNILKRCRLLERCEVCVVELQPNLVQQLHHALERGHIKAVYKNGLIFSKETDLVPLVQYLLQARNLWNVTITSENVDKYLSLFDEKVSPKDNLRNVDLESILGGQGRSRFIEDQGELKTWTFFEGRKNCKFPLTKKQCLENVLSIHNWFKDYVERDNNCIEEFSRIGPDSVFCEICAKQAVNGNDRLRVMKHALSRNHISKIYAAGQRFCKEQDLLPLARLYLRTKNKLPRELNLDNLFYYLELARNNKGAVDIPCTVEEPEDLFDSVSTEDDYETPLSTKAATPEPYSEVVAEAPCCSNQANPSTPVPSLPSSCGTIEEVYLPEEEAVRERAVEIDEETSINLSQNAFVSLEANVLKRDRNETTVRYNARQESVESSSASSSFERLEFPETQRPARRTKIAIEATSVESCSSVLEAMEPVIEPGLSKETDHSDCDLSPSAVTVSHMHFFSTEQDILTTKELSTVSSLVYKAAQKGRKCFRSTYAGLKLICTPTCYVCGFQAMCCCEYTLHVFSPTHINLLNIIQTPVSRTSFNFWLGQLAELRAQSPHPFIALELELSGPPVLKNKLHVAPKLSLSDIPRISHPPVSCRLGSTPTTLVFMNGNSPSNDLPIEGNTLSLLTRVITVHYSNQCFQPSKGCPFIRHYCPSICRVCSYKSSCACRYILHLFGAQHVDALKRIFIKITLSDIHFWLRHLESFSNQGVNWRMRPILQPIVSISQFIPPSQYPQYALPIYHVFPSSRPVNTNNGCIIC